MTIKRIYVCGLLALIITLTDVSFAENWPCFRGPSRQGISREKEVPLEWSATSNIAWKASIPGEGWSSPIVYDNRVFVTAATEDAASFRLLCLDRSTGTVLWNKHVLRQTPGHKQQYNSYASSTPATDGRMIYAIACDGSIAAVSMDGTVVWTNRDHEHFSEHGLAVSPVLYQDLVIVAFDGSSSGPDKKLGWQKPWDKAATGDVVWRKRIGSKYSASPIWAEGRIYFLSEKGKTTVIEAGLEFKILAENELNEKCCASPAVSNQQLFIRSEHNLFCIGTK